MSIIARQWQCF